VTYRVALVTGLACAGLAAAPARAGSTWVEIRSAGFTIYGADGEKAARRVANRLEDMRAFLQQEWPWARFAPELPVVVLALRNPELRRLLPVRLSRVEVGGITFLEPHRTLMLLRTDVPDDLAEENPYHVAYHEYAHAVLGRSLPLPPWLSEGLAEYWGSTKIRDNEIEFGRPIAAHVHTLRGRRVLPLKVLFEVDHSSHHYNEQDRATIFYAESWALVHYLALGAPARGGQLNRLVERLAAGRDALNAAAEILGDFEALQRELEDYVGRDSFKYRRRLRQDTSEDAAGKARRLSRAEVLTVRGEVLLSAGRGEGRSLIQEALDLDPGLVAAAEALGIAAWRAQDLPTARSWLERARSTGRAGFFTHYALGLVAAASKAPDERVLAEPELREALRLNPVFAPALVGLATVTLGRGGASTEALRLLERAIELDPGDPLVLLGVAGCHAQLGRLEEARGYATAAQGQARDARVAFQAAQILKMIGTPEANARPGTPEREAAAAPGSEPPQGADEAPARLYEERCDEGEAEACLALAEKLELGLGLPVDKPKAARLRERACAAGLRLACLRPQP
jgi:tetratricopeptide (TPR) repeat protein